MEKSRKRLKTCNSLADGALGDAKNQQALIPAVKAWITSSTTDSKAWKDIWGSGQGIGLIEDAPTVESLVERIRSEQATIISNRNLSIGTIEAPLLD